MKKSLFINCFVFLFPLILALFLVSISTIQTTSAGIGEQAILVKHIETGKLHLTNEPCYPNTGWTWTKGAPLPEVSSQVQQALAHLNIEVAVEAISIGETDSCGTFKQYAVDFAIQIISQNPTNLVDGQTLAKNISPVLLEFGKPNLGNVKITSTQGNIIPLNFESTTNSFSELDTTEANTTQVDATLPWQATGISFSANDSIEIEVTSGLWTHWLGTEPYNNGSGESYICTDFLPGNECAEPLPNAPKGALIGQIGSHIFLIGSGNSIVAQQSGELHLRINDGDDGLFDNDGTLTVETTISPQDHGFTRHVFVIVYDPFLSNNQMLVSEYYGWNDHETLTQDTVNFFQQTSNNQLTYSIVETTIITSGWPIKTDRFQYTEMEYLDVMSGHSPPHNPDSVDYNAIVNDPSLDICGRANRGEIDEVWIYNGPYFGFYESTLVGPGAYWYNSPPVPGPHSCNRLIPIMGPSPERHIDSAIHNFGHRTESAMTKVYGSWQQNRTAHNWERFALVDSLSSNYVYSGCGNTHFPPNGTSDYNYSNLSTANTNCEDFLNYPHLGDPTNTTQPVTCTTWDCSEIGFHNYWFSHLPSAMGCDSDDVANHWWRYLFEPERALDPSLLCNEVYLPSIIR